MIIGLSHRARGPAVLRALLIGSAMIPLAIGIARAEPVDGPAAAAAPAPRGNASITGTISQAGSGDYLDGASVSIPALGLATAADRAGRFTLAGIPAGTHDVVVRYVGFPDARRSVTVTDAAVVLDVAMTIETNAAGDEIVVSGSRPIAESEIGRAHV